MPGADIELEAFCSLICSEDPSELARRYVFSGQVCVFASPSGYELFRSRVQTEISNVEYVAIVGSGNWNYSLNPRNNFSQFHVGSDIDVAVISHHHFTETWTQLRRIHRDKWYTLSRYDQDRLRRNGENVYSGFVSPRWLPDQADRLRFEHERMLNKLSDFAVGYRKVGMLFFKDEIEVVDYYSRGFAIAAQRLGR